MSGSVQKVSLKASIEKQLEEKGTLSSADIEAAQAAMTGTASPKPEPETPEAPVPTDPMIAEGLKKNENSQFTAEIDADSTGFTDLAIEADEILEITQEDKDSFLDALEANTRFTRKFSLFDGRIEGIFRARTNAESVAIIKEMTRQLKLKPMLIEDYAQQMRHALLHCQIAEYKGAVRKELEEPLSAAEQIVDNKVVIQPPKWYTDMQIVFAGKDEGVTIAVYNELRRFEKVYWTMIRSASSQNFWHPEVSSIA